ncbi:hypothetical protein I5421_04290 [Citrobacter braakii]|nr:hypothetical protein [Citrobacter braakii]MBJ8900812.1 hypothetical protein [Citrobacter braakii]MBJ8905467.1 hypothetical protein [Citrobacter braakii]MBJ8922424.1 hypothetical protein [Citrobacter braakii]
MNYLLSVGFRSIGRQPPLSAAMRSLPLGTTYITWTGAVGSFVVGLYFLGEPATPMRILAAVVIVTGLIMMKLASWDIYCAGMEQFVPAGEQSSPI